MGSSYRALRRRLSMISQWGFEGCRAVVIDCEGGSGALGGGVGASKEGCGGGVWWARLRL